MKERKKLILPGLGRKPIKSLTQDLRLSRRHRAPSRGWGVKSQGALLRKSEKPGQGSEQDGSLCSKESAEERERERKREKERKGRKTDRHGDPSSDGAKVL